MAPDDFLVIVDFDPDADAASLARFRSLRGFAGTTNIIGPWRGGGLSAGSGVIRLLKPDLELEPSNLVETPLVLVEEVQDVLAVAAGPAWRGALGLSLVRRDSSGFADDPAGWVAAPPSPGGADTDLDGLPDAWEREQGLDPESALGPDGAGGDPDGDGLSNWEELLSGTAPQEGASYFGLQAVDLPGGEIELRFRTAPGRSYTLQSRDNLKAGAPAWQNLRSVIGPPEGGETVIRDVSSRLGRFYRVTMP
jgi:hypothetical protein